MFSNNNYISIHEKKQELPKNTVVKKLKYNTWQVTYPTGTIEIHFHHTPIITITETSIIIKNDGWFTKTTKDRINEYLPENLQIISEKGIWFVQTPTNKYIFYDGITFDKETFIITSEILYLDLKKIEKVKRNMNHLIKQISESIDLILPLTNQSDCMFCNLYKQQNALDKVTSIDHLLFHIKNKKIDSILIELLNEKYNILTDENISKVYSKLGGYVYWMVEKVLKTTLEKVCLKPLFKLQEDNKIIEYFFKYYKRK